MKNAWRSWGLSTASIIVLTVMAYIPAMRGGFIWDDVALVVENQMVRASDGLYRFWCTTEAPDYWPLTSSAWWLEWRLWGARPMGYHVINVLLHAVNAVLVWIILRRLKIPGAWLVGLVFAVHPVNVATVAWISEQKNTLSMFFYAVAILLYLRFDEEDRCHWYGLSLAAFLLALLSKAAVVMLPVVLLGCVWWTHGQLRWKDFLRSVPFFGLSLVSGLATIWFQCRGFGEQTARTDGLAARLVAAGWIPWFYLYKALLPFNLSVIYPNWNTGASRWISYLPGVALVSCCALFWWKRQTWGRPLLFALGYFVVTLFPVLGFFNQSFHRLSLVADQWQYFSIIGPIAWAVPAGVVICRRMDERCRYLGTMTGVAALMLLGVATWERTCVYASNETLWRDTIAKNPKASAAHYNLGIVLRQAGRPQEALRQYEQALWLKPDHVEAHNNLGNILLDMGQLTEALGHYEQALRLKPDYVEAHKNAGDALLRLGRVTEALGQYDAALRINPDDAETHNNLGNILLQLGRVTEAQRHYEQALHLNPGFAEAHYKLGTAFVRVGRVPEAIGHWEQALRIKPDYPEAHYDLGVALAGLGRVQEAMEHWEQALRIKPDYAEAHYNLGLALEQAGRLEDAIGHWREALRVKPDYAETHYNLGVALEQAGQLKEAIGHYEQALRIKPDLTGAQNRLARLRGVQ